MAISDDQKAQVLALHTEGLARNEIARRVGISAGSVTNLAETGRNRSSWREQLHFADGR